MSAQVSMALFTLLNLCFELGEEMIAYRHATLPWSLLPSVCLEGGDILYMGDNRVY